MSSDQDLVDYRALLEKVSAKFSEIFTKYQFDQNHQKQMMCGRGCSECCAPGLTVSPVERENIRRHLLVHPELVASIESLEKRNPHQGKRCSFLDDKGECSIYEVRPIICRSHGAPIFAKTGRVGEAGRTVEAGQAMRDVCPLNFSSVEDLSQLPGDAFINLDLLNQILALLNQRFAPHDPLKRVSLTLDGITGIEHGE